MHLIGTPEGTLVTIIETVSKLQNQGLVIKKIIERIEDYRKNQDKIYTNRMKF